MTNLEQEIVRLNSDSPNEESRKLLSKLTKETIQMIGQEEAMDRIPCFKQLWKKLNKPKKISMLGDKNHRLLVIELIKHRQISLYHPSYFNRAKITDQWIKLLREVGPYLFTEGIVIISKLNMIHKHFSRRIIEDNLYNQNESLVDQKISQILKTCTERNRRVNNNGKKLQMLLQNDAIRVELIKQLGKLLRDAWKMEKGSKGKGDIDNKKISQPQNKDNVLAISDLFVKRDIDEIEHKSISSESLCSFRSNREQFDLMDRLLGDFALDFI